MSLKRSAAELSSGLRLVKTENSTTKEVRFSDVVKASGEPEAVDLWAGPEANHPFMSAVRQNRVMSIQQQRAGKGADFGSVDFLRGPNISYLIFPKSLAKFANRRVIGIKYELVRSSPPLGPVIKPTKPSLRSRLGRVSGGRVQVPSARPIPAAQKAVNKAKKFRVVVEFSATTRVTSEVEANSKKEAKALALARVTQPDLNNIPVSRKWVSTTAVGGANQE